MFVVSGSLSLLRISIGVFQGPDSPSPRSTRPASQLEMSKAFSVAKSILTPFVAIVGCLRSMMRLQMTVMTASSVAIESTGIKQGFLASW
jgi:hypothetical protein